MKQFDIFNGDADGICSLLQLRHAMPCESTLITGIKRDIKLLAKVHAEPGDNITALDISLDKNRNDLIRNLERGAKVFYVDHHFCGEIPQNDNLSTLIDTDANICTSLLINHHLSSQNMSSQNQSLWAITGAFGDNLKVSAQSLAKQHQVKENDTKQLKSLGIYINYNGYGADISDLHFPPDQLFQKLLSYKNPLDCIHDSDSVFSQLKTGFEEDNNSVNNIKAEYQTEKVALFILPDETWARRISGVYSNELANQNPDRAHAVLTRNKSGGYLISVRAPINNKIGADELCRQFESGGGRKAAAGINHLPKPELDVFIEKFALQFS